MVHKHTRPFFGVVHSPILSLPSFGARLSPQMCPAPTLPLRVCCTSVAILALIHTAAGTRRTPGHRGSAPCRARQTLDWRSLGSGPDTQFRPSDFANDLLPLGQSLCSCSTFNILRRQWVCAPTPASLRPSALFSSEHLTTKIPPPSRSYR